MLLQIDDYALLAGSVALFLILAAVMFLRRKIDWYGLPRTVQADAGVALGPRSADGRE